MAPNSVIAVLLNIGHKASHRNHLHPQGFTHDWSAYVKGADGINIEHFVEKVVFTLHETFAQPIQVVTKPPYMIKESGYASFGLKLDIHFSNESCRNGENVIHYEYDLYLPGDGQPSVKAFRQERLLFKTTPPEFRAKLLAGGAKETDPETLSEMAKEKEKSSLSVNIMDSMAQHKNKTDSDDDKKEKKKKSKDKDKSSKHKKTKSDRDRMSLDGAGLAANGGLFGLPRSHEDRPAKTTGLSSNSSSSSSSNSSDTPANSPQRILSTKAKNIGTLGLSASDSSSDSDDEMGQNTNNSASNKRSLTNTTNPLPTATSKKSRTADKPTKKSERNSNNALSKGPNGVPLDTLLDLYEKIKAITDPNMLQRCVDAVEDTRQFHLSETTFDFDLCQLEAPVIHKLENMLK